MTVSGYMLMWAFCVTCFFGGAAAHKFINPVPTQEAVVYCHLNHECDADSIGLQILGSQDYQLHHFIQSRCDLRQNYYVRTDTVEKREREDSILQGVHILGGEGSVCSKKGCPRHD